jgi:hypothetical protein
MSKDTVVTDSGHGWLSVPLEELKKLGIADKISAYSYITAKRAYLEEDVDAATFLDAAGIDIKSIPTTYSTTAKCRGYAAYHPSWVNEPFRIGRTVYVCEHGNKYKGTVTGLQRERYIVEVEEWIPKLQDTLTTKYGLPASNPIKYCFPTED